MANIIDMDEMVQFIAQECIIFKINKYFPNKKYQKSFTLYLDTGNFLRIRIYHRKSYNKLYVIYELDSKFKTKKSDIGHFYLELNKFIIKRCREDYHITAIPIGSCQFYIGKLKDVKYEPVAYIRQDCLDMNTIGVFKDMDKRYKFLCDKSESYNDIMLHDKNILNSQDPENEFFVELQKINQNNNFILNNEEIYNNAFDSYKTLYNNNFGKIPEGISTNDIKSIYYEAL